MAQNGLSRADVQLRDYSLHHSYYHLNPEDYALNCTETAVAKTLTSKMNEIIWVMLFLRPESFCSNLQ